MNLSACSSLPYPDSPQYRDGSFHNPVAPRTVSWRQMPALWWRFMFDKPAGTIPAAPIPLQPLSAQQLADAPDGTLYRLGHSTLLLKLEGALWLTDPVFSERASPVQWAGPKRFHSPPIGIAELPPIKGVVLSHDHYDHLDKAAVLALAEKTELFVTPLGVGDHLIRWGVPPEKVRQLDWWESISVDGVRLVATPSQHFSGRSPFDSNPTLWASWVLQGSGLNLFFSGDTGYFDGFRDIGRRYGPFDVTMLECGAYDAMWEGVHMLPTQTLQAHRDLQGQWLLPIHNSTFDLAFHVWNAPLETLIGLAEQQAVSIATPQIGQPVDLRKPQPAQRWWQLPR
jgi:L-ascorbate metabolism protein UlaG (beta-lactamase superfamily)